MSNDINIRQIQSCYPTLGIAPFMEQDGVTEIAINDDKGIWVERHSQWEFHPHLFEVDLHEQTSTFGTLIVNYLGADQPFNKKNPMLSATLPTGQRCQLVLPPAANGHPSITIRVPSKLRLTLNDYAKAGMFDRIQPITNDISEVDKKLLQLKKNKDYAGFLKMAILSNKNIVFSGATGSGKTLFMMTLLSLIPHNQRIITIEDAREIILDQPNKVHLVYPKKGEGAPSSVTAKTCLEATLRMKPCRIALAEIRGDEAFYFARACGNGHSGSITSCHADSALMAYEQIAYMIQSSPEGSGLGYDVIKRLLHMTIDISIHIHKGDHRHITGIDFQPERKLNTLLGNAV